MTAQSEGGNAAQHPTQLPGTSAGADKAPIALNALHSMLVSVVGKCTDVSWLQCPKAQKSMLETLVPERSSDEMPMP